MTDELVPGTVLLDKYRVDGTLGRGGMGVVLAATHLQLRERVAIKLLRPDVLRNEEVVARFLREARAAVRLKGEHVARVIDVGALPSGAPYMVMEFLDGADLSSVIQERGSLPPSDAVDLLLQACEALAEAHALGIVHRDLKPANLFVTKRPGGSPLLKVLDFGISKAPTALEGGLTSTNAVMGTPLYMSPEQMRSAHDVDARTDQWALGVVLYECLGGRPPFEAETFASLCLKAAIDPTPPLRVALPPGLAKIVYRCLAKEPTQRFDSMATLAAVLAPYAGNKRQAALIVDRATEILRVEQTGSERAEPARKVARDAAAPVPRPSTLGASTGSRSSERSSARRGAWIVAALIGSIALALAVFAVSRKNSHGTEKADDSTKDERPWPKAKLPEKTIGMQTEPTIAPILSGGGGTAGNVVVEIAEASAVLASSTHSAAAGYHFAPENLVDGDLETSWQPAESPDGSSWVRLEFARELAVASVRIANGFQTHDQYGDEFLNNSRVATGRLRFSDGAELPVQFPATTRGFVEFDVPGVKTRSVTLLVDSTHRGSKWPDLAISEVQVRASRPAKPVLAGSPPPIAEDANVDESARAFLASWLVAQNHGDFDGYSRMYADDFTGVRRTGSATVDLDRNRWLRERRRMFKAKMTVSAISPTFDVDDTVAEVSFTQEFSVRGFHDKGPKHLVLVRLGGDWLISHEEMLSSDVSSPPPKH